jgi:predicted nucleic acid-binding protein
MKVVVCDASPLIFLAKLDRLSLISAVLGGNTFVLKCIVDEVLSESAGPHERVRLSEFLEQAQIVDFEDSRAPSRSLSRSDQSVLVWAIENRADWLVADERMLRRIAVAEGIRVVGFFGLLIGAVQRGILSRSQARLAIDEAISKHGCRISIDLYRRLLAELGYGSRLGS